MGSCGRIVGCQVITEFADEVHHSGLLGGGGGTLLCEQFNLLEVGEGRGGEDWVLNRLTGETDLEVYSKLLKVFLVNWKFFMEDWNAVLT